jgi:putative FmdB family regulatory protein
MPIYEIECQDCSKVNEVIVASSNTSIECPSCGSKHTEKLMSATSTLTGHSGQQLPGPGDTSCCGKSASTAGCAGPGSCCGRTG